MEQEKTTNGPAPEHAAIAQVESVAAVSEGKPDDKKESPKPVPPKKELTPSEMQRRKKMVIMPLFFLIFAGIMWLIFAPSKKEDGETAGQSGFNAELPIPKDEGIVGDKRTAYEQEAQREREQNKARSLQDLSAMFEQTGEQKQEEYEAPSRFEGGTSSRSNRSNIQSSATAYQDINRQLGAWYDEPATEADEQAQLAIEWRIQELERKLSEAEAQKAAENEQEALLEKSYLMAAKYMPPGTVQGNTAAEQPAASETADTPGHKVKIQPVKQVRQNVVSLLCAPIPDAEFIEAYSQPRNLEFLTAAGNKGALDKNTIRACVYQTITLTTGKELQIRLLEPMRAGDILIPANTVITGTCRIGGERLEITINSIQYADNIIPVELSVYDTDGQRGIFVPGSEEINAAKEVASTLASSAGTSIMISDNAGSQLAADMGKGLIQGASQYVSKKMSVVKVTLKANYQLLLLPKTQ